MQEQCIHLFCPQCGTYLGNEDVCACGYRRAPVERPVAAGEAFWRRQVPGKVGSHLALVEVEGRPLLLVPWTQWSEYRPATGGVVALDARTGEEVWTRDLGAPVEAGVAVTLGRVLVPVHDTLGSSRLVILHPASGDVLGTIPINAAVVNTPVAVERRVYFAGDDGALYAVDALSSEVLPGFPHHITEHPVPIRASPVLVGGGREETLIVATYSRRSDRVPGIVVAITVTGRVQWQHTAYGTVRGTPVVVGRRLYVTAYRDHPVTGILFALDVVNGRPLWKEPFTVGPESAGGRRPHFSASPRVVGDVVYVTSVNRYLYAVDARSGRLLWNLELPRSMATQPLWVHGLLLIAVNDARVHAVDTARRKHLADAAIVEEDLSLETQSDSTQPGGWPRRPRVNALTQPLLWGDVLFAAATDGTVVALPWHLGQYAWVAEQFLNERQFLAAGDHFALAAHVASTREEREKYWQRAVNAWQRAEHYDRIGALYLAQGRREEAAQALLQAARAHRHRDWQRALAAARRALRLYKRLRLREPIVESMRLVSDIMGLPFVRVEKFNAARYRLWEEGLLELKVSNEGPTPARNLRLRLGGSLERSVELSFDVDLPANTTWIVPLRIVPTREQSRLDVEAIYSDVQGRVKDTVMWWSIPLEAEPPPTPPPEIKIGDVGHMELVIESLTREGVRIHTRDVGLIRGKEIGNVDVSGDAGAISSAGEMGQVHVRGDVALVRGSTEPHSRVCSQGHKNPPDARFCAACGEALDE